MKIQITVHFIESNNVSISGTMARTDAHFSQPLNLNMNAVSAYSIINLVYMSNYALFTRKSMIDFPII